jgi:hypothetical protein
VPTPLTNGAREAREAVDNLISSLNPFEDFVTTDLPPELNKIKVTQYLYTLSRKGVIARIGTEVSGRVGRPAVVYRKIKR